MLLKEYLERNGIYLTSFARAAGITREHLRGILDHRSYPSRRLTILINIITRGDVSKMELMFPEDFEDEEE